MKYEYITITANENFDK